MLDLSRRELGHLPVGTLQFTQAIHQSPFQVLMLFRFSRISRLSFHVSDCHPTRLVPQPFFDDTPFVISAVG